MLQNKLPTKLILIGASTGGPGLIAKIISSLCPPKKESIVIALHMDPLGLSSYAKRLSELCGYSVNLVTKDHCALTSGKLYLLSATFSIEEKKGSLFFKKTDRNKSFYNPTIDTLFASANSLSSVKIAAYLLSGIGEDGAKGLSTLQNAGHKAIAQDEHSSIVYGMPKKAYELNNDIQVLSIDEIIQDIQRELKC
ncbi:two-component system, chemotaxis family, protein-glutamate methylesterase/glutaminase [Nitratiruptor sp. YY08-14]|nr:two-component system, chemotaxis family, protein-glutamate methylesterase/glutaminase [Nitratiruptor sp. YY08-10]BCD64145.1 two-component system, chemotaxis family, protein-glutamate methylesterase/glutaminase [Nitratiruptor sp. YY08-14]